MSVQVREVQSGRDRKQFVKLPWSIYRDDSHWVPHLLVERLETIDPKKNPFFGHGEAALFLAERGGEVVGRISAQVNHLSNEYHKDKTGFFGFFECVKEQTVADALFESAAGWLRARGCDRVLGPESFSTNEEVGLLVQGFEHPAMIFCPYNPPYYADLIERAGFEKAKDLFGWMYTVGEVPEAPRQIAEAVEAHPGLTVRPVDPKHMRRDVEIVRDIFNEAWSRNWGYVPWTDAEVEYAAKNLKMILAQEITAIAELDGVPIGMMLAFPNIMEVIGDLDGRLFPFGLFKLLYRVKLGGYRFKSARLLLLGIKPEFRGSVLGGLSVLLYVKAHIGARAIGIERGELGWTLEDNQKINTGIAFMGGRNEKVYRVYGKPL